MVREEIRLTPLKTPAWKVTELPVYNKIRYVVVPFFILARNKHNFVFPLNEHLQEPITVYHFGQPQNIKIYRIFLDFYSSNASFVPVFVGALQRKKCTVIIWPQKHG